MYRKCRDGEFCDWRLTIAFLKTGCGGDPISRKGEDLREVVCQFNADESRREIYQPAFDVCENVID